MLVYLYEYSGYDRNDNYFEYTPSLALCIISIIVFAIEGIILLALNIKFKAWFFMVLPVAAAMEIFGFGWRIHMIYNLDDKAGFILYIVPILLAPTVIAAADYALVSKLMKKAGVGNKIFRPSVVRYFFLAFDVIAFAIQGAGGGLLGGAETYEESRRGSQVVLVGLAISLAVFFFFTVTTIYIHVKMSRNERADPEKYKFKDTRYKRIFIVLYIDMVLFLIRSAYRVAEFSYDSFFNPVSNSEGLFYGLDILLMAIVLLLWIPFHPGFYNFVEKRKDRKKDKNSVTVKLPKEEQNKIPEA